MLIVRNSIILIALIPIIPLMILLSMLIIIEDGKPAIFAQKRIGLNKKVFTLFKISTMKNNTIQTGTHNIEARNILKVGKIIRKLKLDEFLQLINVLRGEINLVGPRPSLENQFELINVRDKLKVLSIKPGITGLSQVCGYDMSDENSLANVDRLYINHQTFLLDAKILVATFTGVFKKSLKKEFDI